MIEVFVKPVDGTLLRVLDYAATRVVSVTASHAALVGARIETCVMLEEDEEVEQLVLLVEVFTLPGSRTGPEKVTVELE
jgi:hypothetical protein